MNAKQIRELQGRITRIKKRLSQLGDLRPGSLSRQYNVCGNPTCRCKDPANPKKHGPYYQLSYTHRGKGHTEYIQGGIRAQTKQQLQNYKKFRALTMEWVDRAIELAKVKAQLKKAKDSKKR